ncbi:hypothetical protein AB0F46_35390 [Streptomyces sp. NPDC026665]
MDYETAADTLCLNAELISSTEARGIDAALRSGSCTAGELIRALVPNRE